MLKIDLNTDLSKTKFTNDEHRHLSLLLFLKDAQSLFFSASELLGTKDNFNQLRSLYNQLPKELLEKCGYSKNNNSFEKIKSVITHILGKEDIYTMAVSTEYKDLPLKEELNFLKVNK